MIYTLPGTIPALLRIGAPVINSWGQPGIIVGEEDWAYGSGTVMVVNDLNPPLEARMLPVYLKLDLTKPLGRLIAATWFFESLPKLPKDDNGAWIKAFPEGVKVLDKALKSDDMTPEQVNTLALLVTKLDCLCQS